MYLSLFPQFVPILFCFVCIRLFNFSSWFSYLLVESTFIVLNVLFLLYLWMSYSYCIFECPILIVSLNVLFLLHLWNLCRYFLSLLYYINIFWFISSICIVFFCCDCLWLFCSFVFVTVLFSFLCLYLFIVFFWICSSSLIPNQAFISLFFFGFLLECLVYC